VGSSIDSIVGRIAKGSDVRVLVSSWPQKFGLKYYHFTFEMKFRETFCMGHGCDLSEELALTKAVAEAVERWAFQSRSSALTTNGFAAHIDPLLAADNSLKELLERDAFLCHMISGAPMIEVSPDSSIYYEAILKMLYASSIELSCALAHTFDEFWCVRVQLSGNSNDFSGINISLGASRSSPEEALDKALLEAIPSIGYLRVQPQMLSPAGLQEFEDQPSLADFIVIHHRLSCECTSGAAAT